MSRTARLLLAGGLMALLLPGVSGPVPAAQWLWPASTPNDPDYPSAQAAYLQAIEVPSAWDVTTGSDSVVVAVLDSGVDATHPDLANRVMPGWNVMTSTADTTDQRGHGTKMAGIVGAMTNNAVGVAGVTWAARIMPVKVTSESGAATDLDVAKGIVWAADHGARVISISLSAPVDGRVLQGAVDHAAERDVLVVAAAGNHGSATPEWPGACHGVVAVGATDASGHRAPFSNHGLWVDVSAPGVDIVTTKLNAGFTPMSGTSASAALVSGVAALLRAAHPTATAPEIADRLRRSAFGRGAVGAEGIDASGLVDAGAALRLPPRAPASADGGYLMLGEQGKVDAFGAGHRGDAWGDLEGARATHVETAGAGGSAGYWILDERGRVHPFGGAPHDGDLAASQLKPGERAVSLRAVPGGGYLIFTDAGRVFPFGRAQAVGDLTAVHLNRPIVAASTTSTGRGYFMAADDGGVFTFGDARFAGSMGGQSLNAPVRSIAADPDGDGYWLAATDGGVFAFSAPYRGSLGSTHLNAPISGMAACGDGYFLVATDGGVFAFSNCPFRGAVSAGGTLNRVVGLSPLQP
jgi:hypothetical protein